MEAGGGVKIRQCPPRGGGMGTLLDAVGRFCAEVTESILIDLRRKSI